MTTSTKWIYALLGFVVCFYSWWVFPSLWLIYFAFLAILAFIPTKPSAHPPVQSATQAATVHQGKQTNPDPTSDDVEAIIAAIEARMREAVDPAVQEGLRQALQEVQRVSATSVADDQLAPYSHQAVQIHPPVQTEQEIAAAKKQQELRNINTLLYVASFLLVGAAALFIGLGTNLPEFIKFSLVLIVAVGFYGVGMVLHRISERLQPAGVAFVGTGLALIPFVGLAFYSYVVDDGPLVWWLTSLIGLAGFWLALLELKKPIVSYLTLAFVFSVVTSSVSALHAPFVWYFVAIILTSTVLQYISHKSPTWLPHELKLPLGQNAQLAAPVALLGSIFGLDVLSAGDYTIISGVGMLHYAVHSLGYGKQDTSKYLEWVLTRVTGLSFILSFTYLLTESWPWVSFALLTGAVVLYGISLIGRTFDSREIWWFWVAQGLIAVAIFGWLGNMIQVSAGLIILGVISAHQLYIVKNAVFGAAGVVAAALLPFTISFGVIDPTPRVEYVALTMLMATGLAIGTRAALHTGRTAYKYVMSALYMVFAAEAGLLALVSGDDWWIGAIVSSIAGLLYLASFIERQPAIHVVSNLVAVCGVYALYSAFLDSMTWSWLATAWTLGVAWYALRWYFAQPESSDQTRSQIMLASTLTPLSFVTLILMWVSETTVAAALTGCALAAIVAYEGLVRKQVLCYEIAMYIATLCLQRLIGYVYPDTNALIYTHWWAIVIGLAGLLYLRRQREHATVRAIVALAFFSVPTALFALTEGDGYQLLFLIEHTLLIVAGVVMSKKIAVQWGAVGVAVSVLWLLKGYTYILLALLAFGLIGFAIWRLLKKV